MPNVDIFGAGIQVIFNSAATGDLDVFSIQMNTGDYFGGGFSVPRMTVQVNVGKVVNNDSGKSQITATQFKKLVSWAPATVKVIAKSVPGLKQPTGLSPGSHTIFDGAVVAVSLAQEASFSGGGNVLFQIEMEHKVAGLFQGDMSTYPIFGASPMAANWAESQQKRIDSGLKNVQQSKDLAEFTKAVFAIRAIPDVEEHGSQKESIFKFSAGGDVMSQLAAVDFKFSIEGIAQLTLQNFYKMVASTALNGIGYETSYWDLLNMLVSTFDGWIVPSSDKVIVRPRLAIPKSIEKTITAKEYTKVMFNRGAGGPMDKYVGGGAAYGSGVIGQDKWLAGSIHSLMGSYVLPTTLRRGSMLLRYELPPSLNMLVNQDVAPSGDGAQEMEMLKPFLRASKLDTPSRILPNAKFVQDWLAFRCMHKAVASSGVTLYTPLRFDIGIGNGVQIELPTADGTTSLGSVVGTVSGFDISIDAETRTPVSIFRIAGVLEKSVYASAVAESKNAFTTKVDKTGPWCS
jgi:hypothetical protein